MGQDMLLFQWGTYDWGQGPRFELDMTRQFLVGPGEDEDIWQLSLTYRFEPSEALRTLGAGNRWCHKLAELPEFDAYVEASPSYTKLARDPFASAELDYECAG